VLAHCLSTLVGGFPPQCKGESADNYPLAGPSHEVEFPPVFGLMEDFKAG